MDILVLSDSHGAVAPMVRAVELAKPDLILHLGDCWRDAEELEYAFPDTPLYQVPGNCDWGMADLPDVKLVSLDGVKFMLCHGHTFGVKGGYSAAVHRARDAGADVLLCGHTHIPRYEDYGGLQLLNPGSAGYGHTYGLITTQRGCALCSVRTLD